MSTPWNDWYHVTVHTYGSWLRGDPRGWRARHHREHVDGDYKRPPPKGIYDELHAHSKSLMTREAVRINVDLRQTVVDAIVDKLLGDGIEIIVASLDGNHLHLLVRFRDHQPRHWVGRAKKHASHFLRQNGLRDEEGGLWGKRSKIESIKDRRHQLNSFRYILYHQDRGAAIWRFDRKK